MFNDRIKLEFVLEMIDDIESYKIKYVSLAKMFEDRMCYNAVLMNLLQIGESLNKLSPELKIKYNDILPIKDIYDTRNFIAHDYGGVRSDIVKDIIETHLENLKDSVKNVLKEL